MSEKIPLRKWIENFNNGLYDEEAEEVQWSAGWDDYFCGENELCIRLRKIGFILNHITNDFILDNYRVLIFNNCPLKNPLYDSILFKPLDENKYKNASFYVSCDHPHGNHFFFTVTTERSEFRIESSCDTIAQLMGILNNLVYDFYYKPLRLI